LLTKRKATLDEKNRSCIDFEPIAAQAPLLSHRRRQLKAFDALVATRGVKYDKAVKRAANTRHQQTMQEGAAPQAAPTSILPAAERAGSAAPAETGRQSVPR
jgi:hypothetical protein